MSVSSFIAKRLTVSGEKQRGITPAAVVASGGVALSLAVMMIAIAVTSGFKMQITEKISGFESQIKITAIQNGYGETQSTIKYTPQLESLIRETLTPFAHEASDVDVATTCAVAGMLKTTSDFAGIVFRSYGNNAAMDFGNGILTDGAMPAADSRNEIALSESTATALRLKIGDKINAFFIGDGGIRQRRFKVTGLFNSNFGEFDAVIAYASDNSVKSLRRIASDGADAIEIRGIDNSGIEEATKKLQGTLNRAFATGQCTQLLIATPVTATAASYFNWLDMLDTNIIVILTLMGCVSAFMVISCVLILVLQRVRMVGVLKALGATNQQIESVFTLLGAKVVTAGILIGNAIGLGLIAMQYYFQIIPLNPENYYLNHVPVNLDVWQWVGLNIGFIVLAMAVTLLPATLVRRLSPGRTMRWE